MAVNGVQIESGLNYKANAGGLVFEAKVNLSAITAVSLFVGLTDQTAALEAPVNASGAANGSQPTQLTPWLPVRHNHDRR